MHSRSKDEPGHGSAAALDLGHDVDREVSIRLRTVLHEIQAPILSLRLRIDALVEQSPAALRSLVEDCQTELRQLDEVSRRLLQFDRLQNTEAEHAPVDWNRLFGRLGSRFEPIAASAGVQLVLAPAPAGPTFVSDAERIHLILNNLLDNALRHAPKGTVVRLDCSASGEGVRLTVRDQGPGLPPEELPHLFDPFRRATADEHAGRSGFGLGLSLCRTAATALGGHLEIDSELGNGTSAGVFLPRRLSTDP